MNEDDDHIDPYNSDDSEWDEESLTPRALSKLRVTRRKKKKSWLLSEEEKRKKNRKSNAEVWKKYRDVHEPIVFYPETAKMVAEIAKSTSKTLLYPDGSEYRGPIRGGLKPEGQGTLQWPNGHGSYIGDFHQGLPHGHGRRVYANGESYVGRWQNGKRHGFGIMTNGSDDVILYEGLWREGQRARQAEYAAGLPSPDRAELHRTRVRFNTLGSLAAATDNLVEKMLSAPELPAADSVTRYVAARSKKDRGKNEKRKSSSQVEVEGGERGGEEEEGKGKGKGEEKRDGAAEVSHYYVKKEKLKKIKNAWHSYPSAQFTTPLRQIAKIKVGMHVKEKYVHMEKFFLSEMESMQLSMKARKSIYTRERKALMKDYDKGLEILNQKFKKERRATLKMGVMRGGIAVDRSVREVKKIKDSYMKKHSVMMERRMRGMLRMKEEYMEDMRVRKDETTKRKITMKGAYLKMAWSRHRMEVEQERSDIARNSSEKRRKEFEKKQKMRIKEALSGKTRKRSSTENDLNDNDGKKAQRLYQLSTLHKVLRPSLHQELEIAIRKWCIVTKFKRHTEEVRLDLVKITEKDSAKTMVFKPSKGKNKKKLVKEVVVL